MQLRVRINEDTTAHGILLNGNWQKSDYFIMGCNSEYTGIAYITTIEKDLCAIGHHAILYLAERMVIEEEGWNEAMISDLTEEMFLHFLFTCGYLTNETGMHNSNDAFLKFNEFVNGMFRESNCPVIKNGVPFSGTEVFNLDELVSAVCFDNRWNSEQYLVELTTRWAFFRWSTNA